MTKRRPLLTAKGVMSEHHNCIDCGINTMPGCATREQVDNRLRAGALRAGADTVVTMVFGEHTECYLVKAKVWEAAAMEGYGGCLCIGCLEQRLGRQLRPKDFVRNHPLNQTPGSQRLLERRGDL